MKIIIYSLIIFSLLLSGCNTNPQKKAKQLHDKAIFITLREPDSAKIMKAIELLNQATDLQPDYYVAYGNKLKFQRGLGLWNDAFSTLKVMEQLKPNDPDLKTMLGAFYEHHKKDTIQAKIKYNEADLLYKHMLDTILYNSYNYESVIIGYTLNLKLLGEESEANRILYDYYGEDVKEFIEPFVIQKTREALLIKKYFISDGSIFW